jgi:two-component system, OmpR family, phosphate regulon sensor histidine kinase PhoR
MRLSIRWKVAIGSLLAVICGLAIAGLLAMQSLEQQEIAQLNDMLDARSNLVEYSLRSTFSDPPAPDQQMHLGVIVRQLGDRALARITVITADGTVIADSAVDDAGLPTVDNHLSRPEIRQALATGVGRDIRASQTTGARTMYRALRTELRYQGKPVILRLGLPMTMLERETGKLQRHLAIAIGAAFLILSLWMARSITKPLSDIASAARRLSAGDATIRIQTHSHDEVGLLGETLNQMTDQLRTKINELSEDRAQLLAMLTSMVEGVMVLDCRGRILQINPALERMFDVSRTEIRGQISTEVLAHPELNSLITTILTNRAGQEAEIVLMPGGRCLHIETSVAGCERENEACAVLVFHDITELRRLENIRKDFVANVSHELRTPLTSIKGYVEALLDGGKDDPDTAVNFLTIILKQSDRLNLILEDLLELSKIESGRISFKEDPLDLRSLIERTLSMIKPLADKKGHRLVSRVDDRLPPIAGDEGRLAQVLTNLLDNAVKYTPEQGTITVAARSLPDQTVEFTVTDTGLGIPDQDRPRVFERFYRVDKARSRELGGTGLGLAIVKHIVEGHGGQVWVEAHPPQGSRFVVRLPVTRQTRSSAHTKDDKIK